MLYEESGGRCSFYYSLDAGGEFSNGFVGCDLLWLWGTWESDSLVLQHQLKRAQTVSCWVLSVLVLSALCWAVGLLIHTDFSCLLLSFRWATRACPTILPWECTPWGRDPLTCHQFRTA